MNAREDRRLLVHQEAPRCAKNATEQYDCVINNYSCMLASRIWYITSTHNAALVLTMQHEYMSRVSMVVYSSTVSAIKNTFVRSDSVGASRPHARISRRREFKTRPLKLHMCHETVRNRAGPESKTEERSKAKGKDLEDSNVVAVAGKRWDRMPLSQWANTSPYFENIQQLQ